MADRIKLTEISRDYAAEVNTELYGLRGALEAEAFHRTLEEYSVTPLVRLGALAAFLGIKELYVKDESYRFGLNSFKALGGSFAMHRLSAGSTEALDFVTATDGNHGRGVAWAAAKLGHRAHVFMPRGSAAERLENIRRLGAHAQITDMVYDDTVRYASALAEEKGWLLIQDTAWEGYEKVPALIMQGYTTMGLEITRQLGASVPTHIFLQAGVGSMAAALTAFFAEYYKEKAPRLIIVEPSGADCIFKTAQANDGRLHFCGEDLHSIMAGLCCGEPCTLAWDIFSSLADFSLSCEDSIAADGMRILASPLPGDERIISGESGAAAVGALTELMRKDSCEAARAALGLNADSVVLALSTEGATDTENYRDIVWFGKYSG